MKKIIVLIAFCFLLISMISQPKVFADDFNEGAYTEVFSDGALECVTTRKPSIDAGAAIVMDTKSGRVLYEKNAFSKRSIASTTKIMTAVIAIENGNLSDIVTVSKRAADVGGSSIDLKAGQKISLLDLLYGLMLNSGNDAAVAVAEHIGGTVENFVDMMNLKAEELGAKDTWFKSPHGLDAPGQFSTANDLANITIYALKNEIFSKIVATKSFTIPIRGLYNTNEMLGSYPGADGVKTGYTGQAGRCLVTSATRDNWRIISVVLNSPSRSKRAQSSKSILDYAFYNYKQYTLIDTAKDIARLSVLRGTGTEVTVRAAEGICIPLNSEEAEKLETNVELPQNLKAPVYENVEVGKIQFLLDGRVVAESAVKTAYDVPRKGFWNYLGEIFTTWIEAI